MSVDLVSAMAAAAVAAVGAVDILVSNAGGANDTGFPTLNPAVDARESVEAAPSAHAPVDRGCGRATLLKRGAVELDVGWSLPARGSGNIGGPLDEAAEAVSVGVERPTALAPG